MEIVDPIQDLIEQGLDHALWHLDLRLLASLYGSVELYDVLGKGEGMEGRERGEGDKEEKGRGRRGRKGEIAERGIKREKREGGGNGEIAEVRGRGEGNYASVLQRLYERQTNWVASPQHTPLTNHSQ